MKINKKEDLARLKTASKGVSLGVVSALAMLTLSGQALAADDEGIKVYGNLDTGIENLTNIGKDGDSLTRIPAVTGTMASRLGFKANKDIGDGYKAFATMEMGFSPDDGVQGQGGRIFGRQLNFGLQTPAGRFTIGRQYSPLIFALGDMMGPNIYALGSLDAYLPNARFDNSISWSNKLGENVSAVVAYSFGRDTTGAAPGEGTCGGDWSTVGDSSACRAFAGMLKYAGDGFGLALGIDKHNGGGGLSTKANLFDGTAPVTMIDSGDTDQRITLSGYYNLGDATVSLGLLKREVETNDATAPTTDDNGNPITFVQNATSIKTDSVYLSAKYKVSPKTTVNGAVYSIANDENDTDATLVVLRVLYNLDKGVDTYVNIGSLSNSDKASYSLSPGPNTAPAAGESQTGLMVGFRYIY